MKTYPTWLYHHTKPERLVKNEVEEAEFCPPSDGWADEPYSNEEKQLKKKLPREEPDPAPTVNSAKDQPKGNRVHQEYPTYRYHRTKPARQVKDSVEDSKLDSKEWRDTPWKENEFDAVTHTELETQLALDKAARADKKVAKADKEIDELTEKEEPPKVIKPPKTTKRKK